MGDQLCVIDISPLCDTAGAGIVNKEGIVMGVCRSFIGIVIKQCIKEGAVFFDRIGDTGGTGGEGCFKDLISCVILANGGIGDGDLAGTISCKSGDAERKSHRQKNQESK